MLPEIFIIAAIVLRLAGGGVYLKATLNNKAKPNPVTWFFWALTPTIVLVAQLADGVGLGAAITLALALSPLLIFFASLRRNWRRSQFTPTTIVCGTLAAIGIILWQLTNDPLLAILFSIAADIFGSIPTIIKAYASPRSEVPLPYCMSMASMAITMLALQEWTLASAAFPVYIFCINMVIFSVIIGRRSIKN